MRFDYKARFVAVALSAWAAQTGIGYAAQCGDTAGGFESWKTDFVQEAAARGVSSRALDALQNTSYAQKTISLDRNQRSFKLSFDGFMEKRGANTIIARGKKLKGKYASTLSSIEQQYGVPAGPLLAIWGMETGFGGFLGDQNVLSAVATLAYDCRRSDFFTDHLYAALTMVDRGMLNPGEIGAAHGEIGQTQFLPANALRYGVDGDGDGRIDMVRSTPDALASTANYLRAHGWQPGAGYQPGQPNYGAIKEWNAAGVYQKAIATIGQKIDEG